MKRRLLALMCGFGLSCSFIQAKESGEVPSNLEDTPILENDAKLQLEVYLDQVMCLGESKKLMIDTVGTGRVLHPDKLSLKVVAFEDDGDVYDVNDFSTNNGILEKEVSPDVSTYYKVMFRYLDQKIDTTFLLEVVDIKVFTEGTIRICEGDEVVLKANVVTNVGSPSDIHVWWKQDGSVIGSNELTVWPKGSSSNLVDTVIYYPYVYSDLYTCTSTEVNPVNVIVHRQMSGSLEGKTEVCYGDSVRIDASSYQADTYDWQVDETHIDLDGGYYMHFADATRYYRVIMSRGACNIEDYVYVSVIQYPRIMSIDSLSYRMVEIVIDGYDDAAPYYYSVDGAELTQNCVLEGLTYNEHYLSVVNRYGCKTDTTFFVNAPVLNPILGEDDSVELISAEEANSIVNVYTISGALVKANVKMSEALKELLPGAYTVGSKKVLIK